MGFPTNIVLLCVTGSCNSGFRCLDPKSLLGPKEVIKNDDDGGDDDGGDGDSDEDSIR